MLIILTTKFQKKSIYVYLTINDKKTVLLYLLYYYNKKSVSNIPRQDAVL